MGLKATSRSSTFFINFFQIILLQNKKKDATTIVSILQLFSTFFKYVMHVSYVTGNILTSLQECNGEQNLHWSCPEGTCSVLTQLIKSTTT